MFYIPAWGPVFSPPVAPLQPGELSVAFLECTSTSNTLSHSSSFCLHPWRALSGCRILVDSLHLSAPLPLGARVRLFQLPCLALATSKILSSPLVFSIDFNDVSTQFSFIYAVWCSLGFLYLYIYVSHHLWNLFSHLSPLLPGI